MLGSLYGTLERTSHPSMLLAQGLGSSWEELEDIVNSLVGQLGDSSTAQEWRRSILEPFELHWVDEPATTQARIVTLLRRANDKLETVGWEDQIKVNAKFGIRIKHFVFSGLIPSLETLHRLKLPLSPECKSSVDQELKKDWFGTEARRYILDLAMDEYRDALPASPDSDGIPRPPGMMDIYAAYTSLFYDRIAIEKYGKTTEAKCAAIHAEFESRWHGQLSNEQRLCAISIFQIIAGILEWMAKHGLLEVNDTSLWIVSVPSL
ncbi:hypothetical protein JCM11491_001643 [Sporobolomyces phaffii]